MPPKIAAVTMAYNEAVMLPVWARHYARQVGADYCYVVDHGSTDPIVLPPGMNVIRLPRSAHDDQRRASFIGELVASLLHYYDWVIHTDVDELVVADPLLAPSLPALCANASADTLTAVGLDIQHVPTQEAGLVAGTSLGPQRSWVRFSSALCKPVLTRVPCQWAPGFHSSDASLRFAPLYLFHTHWADRTIGLQRLAKTRTMPWQDTLSGQHQRVADAAWCAMFDGMAALPQRDDVGFDLAEPPLATWLDRTCLSTIGTTTATRAPDLHLNAPELWAIPARFRDIL